MPREAAIGATIPAMAWEREIEVCRDVARRAGERREARMRARVTTPEGARRGRVKDISRTGLFVAMPEPLPVDES